MLFNSLSFLVFFPIVVLVYWLLPVKARNPFLLLASYYFYMNWEPVYALLILFSSVTTWACALWISRLTTIGGGKNRRWVIGLCIGINLLILGVFKYAGFINGSIRDLLQMLGISISIPDFGLLLPVGISFYTFQAIGYTVDVYRGTIRAERSLPVYMLFVSFFPQLVAGPIERAKNLLPQFGERHRFDGGACIHGIYMMLWGYFMKLCIADNVSTYVDAVYNNLEAHNGTSIALATFFFTFQIFCDFAGYSLIAIGTAKCVGFRLMTNFRKPYLSTSIRDFWHRWHISLTSWLTDYVYIPLGGSRCKRAKHYRNILSTFLISGLWHGANWTFVIWGGYHGLLMIGDNVAHRVLPERVMAHRLMKIAGWAGTFLLVMIGWVFFRANTVSDAFMALRKMATAPGTLYNGEGKPAILLPILLIGVLMAKEIYDERRASDITDLSGTPRALGLTVAKTVALSAMILLCASFFGGQFIYFQF